MTNDVRECVSTCMIGLSTWSAKKKFEDKDMFMGFLRERGCVTEGFLTEELDSPNIIEIHKSVTCVWALTFEV